LWHIRTMQYIKLLLVSLCVGAFSQAMADDSPAPSPQAAAAPVSSTPPPASTAAASEAKPQEQDAAAAALAAQTKRLKSSGYKPEVHNGRTLFCRNEPKMGTRFETKVCSDGDIIEQNARDAKDAVQNAQMRNGTRAQ
jgi:hypothetical protein